jgi:hypothetical protein
MGEKLDSERPIKEALVVKSNGVSQRERILLSKLSGSRIKP